MTPKEIAGLIFSTLSFGGVALFIIIEIALNNYRVNKTKKAYRKYQDLAKAKRDYEELDNKFEKVKSECRSIKTRIDNMLVNEKYLTKVNVFNQQKELERFRYELEKLEEEKTKLYTECLAKYEVWKDLRIKYRINY